MRNGRHKHLGLVLLIVGLCLLLNTTLEERYEDAIIEQGERSTVRERCHLNGGQCYRQQIWYIKDWSTLSMSEPPRSLEEPYEDAIIEQGVRSTVRERCHLDGDQYYRQQIWYIKEWSTLSMSKPPRRLKTRRRREKHHNRTRRIWRWSYPTLSQRVMRDVFRAGMVFMLLLRQILTLQVMKDLVRAGMVIMLREWSHIEDKSRDNLMPVTEVMIRILLVLIMESYSRGTRLHTNLRYAYRRFVRAGMGLRVFMRQTLTQQVIRDVVRAGIVFMLREWSHIEDNSRGSWMPVKAILLVLIMESYPRGNRLHTNLLRYSYRRFVRAGMGLRVFMRQTLTQQVIRDVVRAGIVFMLREWSHIEDNSRGSWMPEKEVMIPILLVLIMASSPKANRLHTNLWYAYRRVIRAGMVFMVFIVFASQTLPQQAGKIFIAEQQVQSEAKEAKWKDFSNKRMGQMATPDNHFESLYLRALGEQVSNNRNKASGPPPTTLGTTPRTPSKSPTVFEWARTRTPSAGTPLRSPSQTSSISTKIPGLYFQKWITEVPHFFRIL